MESILERNKIGGGESNIKGRLVMRLAWASMVAMK